MTTSTSALEEVPEGYEPVIITDVDQLADYTESDYIAFIINSDITNSAHRMTGAHQYWSDAVFHSHTLTFAEHSGGAIYGSDYSSISLDGNKNVVFSGNYAQHGSAIYGENYSTINLTSNDSVVFSENNSTSFGGAIYTARNSSSISITKNAAVMFNNNNTNSYGGAIFAYGTVNFTGNDSVTFSENSASKSNGDGGAIWVSSATNFTENGKVMFNNNTADTFGGAIYSIGDGCTVSFSNNDFVTFNGNTAKYGGAIDAGRCAFCFANNKAVTFSSNSSTETGGAIRGGSYGAISLTGNDSVTFSRNAAKYGGAICTFGVVCIQDNDSVTFRGNYEKTESGGSMTYRLRSVYISKASASALTLAAGKGQTITFYDTLYAAMGTEVSFNASYQDMAGVTQDALGDIVFSGAHAEEDLAELNQNYTQQELTDSLTTAVYATTNLYGGRLRIEDGAIYKGNGINVATGSNATLRLAGGALEQSGYDVLLHAGSTLDLEGANSITAFTLEMMDGSTLSFNAGVTEGVMLNLDAALKTGDLHVTVSGDLTKEYALLQLADVSQYDFTQWNSGQVNVTGTDFEHLIWKDGMLTYKPWESTHTDLDKDTEVDDFGGEEGVEIGGHGHSLTVKHPVDLVHLAMENGVVRLEGEENNVVRITLTEDGTLQLAAGAGLNVGNIVSMVATGDADLVISGDIEINDIKAYGKPGNKGTLSFVNMTTKGDYTIENMTITGSVIDVGEGTTLYLVNVDIKSDTHITDAPARVFAQRAHVELNGINTWVDQEITAAQDTLLYMCGDTQRSITLAAGSEIVELTSSMFDSVTLTGTDLWLDMTGIAEATYGKDFFTLDFQDLVREMAKAQVDVENLHVYATLDGEKYTEAYSTANGGLTTTLYFQVPEPATGSLSLLALTALAAARRRQE